MEAINDRGDVKLWIIEKTFNMFCSIQRWV